MRKYLIVVDAQNDFVTGVLGSDYAASIIPKIKKKIENARKQGYTIIYTMDTHGENYLKTEEGKKLPILHCIKDTNGWVIVSKIAPKDEDIIIEKGTFGYATWPAILDRERNIESIELIGYCTDICVAANAIILKAYYPSIKICIDPSCCAGVTKKSHDAALITMQANQIEMIKRKSEDDAI